jgi:hypothetical protein
MVVPARLRAGEVGGAIVAMQKEIDETRKDMYRYCIGFEKEIRSLNSRFSPEKCSVFARTYGEDYIAREFTAKLALLQAKINTIRVPLELRIVDLQKRIASAPTATSVALAASLDRFSRVLVNIVAGYLE